MGARRNERGIAMAISLVAMVVVGVLVSGALFLGLQEQRVGWNTLKYQQAFDAAQEGVQLQVLGWDTAAYNALEVGDSATFEG
ncbi:MAG: hypothetical protein GWN83_05770, partial [Gemmatimonadetes bacterium]|nr:hypothetical protein [Gemmatimonadota bacterium]